MAFSAIGIFCEDIRQEKSEQDTLIGILPDNVNVPSIPGMFPKLGLVVRMHFDVSSSARQFFVILRQSGQPDLRVGDPDDQLIQQAVERVMQERTSLVIAHRLSTIQKCDRIMVFHHGELRESGTLHRSLKLQDEILAEQPEGKRVDEVNQPGVHVLHVAVEHVAAQDALRLPTPCSAGT